VGAFRRLRRNAAVFAKKGCLREGEICLLLAVIEAEGAVIEVDVRPQKRFHLSQLTTGIDRLGRVGSIYCW